jgi:hypothetical protein
MNPFTTHRAKLLLSACLAIASLAPKTLFAQNPEPLPLNFLRNEVGLLIPVFKDQLGSSLSFAGLGVLIDLGTCGVSSKARHQASFILNLGVGVGNLVGEGTTQSAFHLGLRYLQDYQRKISAEGANWRIDLGGRLDLGAQANLMSANTNNSFLYQIAASIGPSVQISRPFRFHNRPFEGFFNLGVPLLAYSARPTFIGVDPSVISDETGIFDNARFVFANRYLAYDYVAGFDKILRNGNRLRFGFRGGYLNDRSQRNGALQRAYNAISFGALFNIPVRERNQQNN